MSLLQGSDFDIVNAEITDKNATNSEKLVISHIQCSKMLARRADKYPSYTML